MSTIQPKAFFTPNDLSNIRNAVSNNPGFAAKTESQPANDGLQDVLIMAPQNKSSFAGSASFVTGLKNEGVNVAEKLENFGVTARVDAAKVDQLKEQGYQVFDNSPRQLLPDMPQVSLAGVNGASPWALPDVKPVPMLHADAIQGAGFTGKNQVVAVLDSGFDFAPLNDKLAFWKDEVNSNAKPHDGAGHGTHVVGDILQTAPDAKIAAIKVMGDDGKGRASDIIHGLQDVLKLKQGGMNINIVNMSLGGAPSGIGSANDPIDKAVELLSQNGITVIAAAGNSGPNDHTIGSPADSPSAIAIGAALDAHHVSTFSSRGPTDDGVDRPDVTAPGEFIKSFNVPNSQLGQTAKVVQTLRDMPGATLQKLLVAKPQLREALGVPEDVGTWTPEKVENTVKPALPPIFLTPDNQVAAPGTSFASPLTAGVAADLEQAKHESPAELKATLRNSADDMGDFDKFAQGAGFVNAEKALHSLQS